MKQTISEAVLAMAGSLMPSDCMALWMALVILSWLKSVIVPSRFLILPTALTICSLLLLNACRSQAWESRRRRAKINPSRNHGKNKKPFGYIPYLVWLLHGKHQILYFPRRLYTSPRRLVKAFLEFFLSC